MSNQDYIDELESKITALEELVDNLEYDLRESEQAREECENEAYDKNEQLEQTEAQLIQMENEWREAIDEIQNLANEVLGFLRTKPLIYRSSNSGEAICTYTFDAEDIDHLESSAQYYANLY